MKIVFCFVVVAIACLLDVSTGSTTVYSSDTTEAIGASMTTETAGGQAMTTETAGGQATTTETAGGQATTTETAGGQATATETAGGQATTAINPTDSTTAQATETALASSTTMANNGTENHGRTAHAYHYSTLLLTVLPFIFLVVPHLV